MLGLAVGDALGMPFEFLRKGEFESPKEMLPMRPDGPWKLPAGYYTDDTSMALCIAQSLVDMKGFDPIDQLRKFVRWKDEGYMSSIGKCFDSGETTMNAIEEFRRTGEPYRNPPTDPKRVGNGILMRLAPIPMVYSKSPADAIEIAGRSARTTHGARVCVDSARYFSGLMVGAISGREKGKLLGDHYVPGMRYNYWIGPDALCPEVDKIASGSFSTCTPKPNFRAVQTLELAMWAFEKTDSFEDAVVKAINEGGDTDTQAAVAGQLAGAHYGASAIPAHWLSKLKDREMIEEMVAKLYQLARGIEMGISGGEENFK